MSDYNIISTKIYVLNKSILLHIFRKLNLTNVLNLSSTCRHFNSGVLQHREYWTHLIDSDEKFFENETIDPYHHYIRQYFLHYVLGSYKHVFIENNYLGHQYICKDIVISKYPNNIKIIITEMYELLKTEYNNFLKLHQIVINENVVMFSNYLLIQNTKDYINTNKLKRFIHDSYILYEKVSYHMKFNLMCHCNDMTITASYVDKNINFLYTDITDENEFLKPLIFPRIDKIEVEKSGLIWNIVRNQIHGLQSIAVDYIGSLNNNFKLRI